jgi:site-specific DNA recombinase
LIAAIYARKSTAQKGIAVEAKSVTRQVENARAFALSKGWTTDDAYVFEDDGKSGAEFVRRPGLQRLLSTLKPKPPFNVLIVSEQKSLGREQFETGHLIKQLAQAGVEIFDYVHGQSLTPKNWLDKAMSAMRSAADEAHREQTSERVHEAHLAKVRRGYVVGGRVFGYRNVDIMKGADQHGRPLRSHVERVIDETEAAVVVRIFELYASGLGLKAIATLLTGEKAAHPKPFRRKDGLQPLVGWSPGTIRTILGRELYHGVVVWNRSRKRDDWGQVDQRRRPKEDWVRVPVEGLYVVKPKKANESVFLERPRAGYPPVAGCVDFPVSAAVVSSV